MSNGVSEPERRLSAGKATAFFTRLANAVDLTDEEKDLLAQLLAGRPVRFGRGQDLIGSDGEESVECAFVLLDGWAIWQDVRADGSRQVLDFFLPGDAIALGAMISRARFFQRGTRTPHHVAALTPVVAVPIERHAFMRLHGSHPELGTQLLALAFLDRSHRYHRRVSGFGRASARARTADLLLEIWERERSAGRATGNCYPLPASQSVLADFLRLAPAYLSRILTALDNDGIVTVQRSGERLVVVHDPERLRDVAAEVDDHGDVNPQKW